jgi:uncharacterized membrane protein SpoIIM required for sporulation
MLETLINPAQAEKGPWKMFFVGLLYGSLSLLLVHWFFSSDYLANFSGMIVVTFCVMFSLPFMYYLIKQEEKQDEEVETFFGIWRAHSDAIFALMWLFLGFVIAFSFWNIVLQDSNLFNAQVGTYCTINSPGQVEKCIEEYSVDSIITGDAISNSRFLSILQNNVYVMIFTLVFSFLFGAGAIFVLAWNASVISAAVGIFSKYEITKIPLALSRYMIHGLPEIAAYFITALAGGMFGAGVIRNGLKSKTFAKVVGNIFIMLFIAIIILVIAAIIEVWITPVLF